MEDDINQLLENWRKSGATNTVFEKDYSIEEERVRMTIYTSIEKPFLFKSIYAVCNLDLKEIIRVIDKLEEKKDELI